MKHFSFILMFVAVMAFISTTADAQSYRRNRNSGLLIDKSSAGHYDPNAGSPSRNSAGTGVKNGQTNRNSMYNMNIDKSSAGHYDGPVNNTPTVTNDYNGNSSSTHSRVCSVCKGKGNYTHEQYMGAAVAGKKKWCSECGGNVSYGHTHRRCETCSGTGIITE